ncbi:hypothetical protein PMIN06_003808 [Paraphaeosphaeria minitans]|uniref:Uncharacterized protein n=1 Tax=Paraphaeosphaeria minitans TaxID=565426 RepID=A0A9P6KS04_9PLEO|nr:hypothetical protein PMIN01_06094 [Paraphaeosphaeria minitans]
MDRDTLAILFWSGLAFVFLAFLSDSVTGFILPVYIVAQILAGSIPTILVYNYIKRRGALQHRNSLFFLLTLIPSYLLFVINLKSIQVVVYLWSLCTSSATSWGNLTHRPYSRISLGEIIFGILVCVLEMLGARLAAVWLEREEARSVAEARFHYINANRAQRPRLTRAQIEEKRARGDFGKLLTAEGFVKK